MHEYFMKMAIEEAKRAYILDESPIGCVIVKDNKIISKGHNLRETLKSATAHAEIIAIDKACKELNAWRLIDCNIYVTLEPCPMCAGAIVNARIEKLIYGASDKKSGASGSLYNITNDPRLNHRLEVIPGILQEECAQLLKSFFRNKRLKKS